MLPATSYLHIVRDTLVSMIPGASYNGLDVEFENVKFMRATLLTSEVKLTIVIHIGSGQFEITEGSTAIVSGVVRAVKDPKPLTKFPSTQSEYPMLDGRSFYKELSLRGYNYDGIFQSVTEAHADGSSGKIKWVDNNWPAFMDCLLQINILAIDSRSLYVPISIRKVRINSQEHMAAVAKLDPENPVFESRMSKELEIVSAGGIEISGMTASSVARKKFSGTEVLESYQFFPLDYSSETHSIDDVAGTCIQLMLENLTRWKVKAVELIRDDENHEPILPKFDGILAKTPMVNAEAILMSNIDYADVTSVKNTNLKTQTGCTFIIAKDCIQNLQLCQDAHASLNDDGFLVSRESLGLKWVNVVVPVGFHLISLLRTADESLAIFKRKQAQGETPEVIEVSSTDMQFQWLSRLQAAMKTKPVLLVAQSDQFSGLLGLVNCIRKEPDGTGVRCVIVNDRDAPRFALDSPFYTTQLRLGLATNVYRNGAWGTYRHLQLRQDTEELPRDGHYFVNMLRLGDLTSFVWQTGALDGIQSKSLVNVQFSSINFKDVMMATGRLPPEVVGSGRMNQQCLLGFEYSGVTLKGDRVMGMAQLGAMATQVESLEHLTWKVPKWMSLREAATIPTVYVTVYYALLLHHPIRRGQSILIHAGSGGIGLAAIRVALAYGLEIFTTVSTPEKKSFIMNLFPKLKGNSTSFAAHSRQLNHCFIFQRRTLAILGIAPSRR